MPKQIEFHPLETKEEYDLYNLPDFQPVNLNEEFLRGLGISMPISKTSLEALARGSSIFERLRKTRQLTSPNSYSLESLSESNFGVHNYTGMCPTNVLEVNPSKGSCSISCLYCLVSDGNQQQPIVVHPNYPQLLRKELELNKDKAVFFYFSPKTEALSEPLLFSGLTHSILREFISHYEKHSDSKVRLFIASKAGQKHLNFSDGQDSIISLMARLSGKMQFNTSIGIMPYSLHEVLEPNASSIESRLEAIKMCNEKGIYARSVLAQPIIPCYLNKSAADTYTKMLSNYRVQNIKPEFLTLNLENLAIVAQFVNYFNPSLLRPLLQVYLPISNQNHIKQRSRLAPDRDLSWAGMQTLYESARKNNISISLCNWVKSQIDCEELTCESVKKGLCCLGYNTELFNGNK
jgi:DNA repair photolyase